VSAKIFGAVPLVTTAHIYTYFPELLKPREHIFFAIPASMSYCDIETHINQQQKVLISILLAIDKFK